MKFPINPNKIFHRIWQSDPKVSVEKKVVQTTEELQGMGTGLTDIKTHYKAIASKTIVVSTQKRLKKINSLKQSTEEDPCTNGDMI